MSIPEDYEFQPGDLVDAPVDQMEHFYLMYVGGGRWVNQFGSYQTLPTSNPERMRIAHFATEQEGEL